MVHNWDDNGPVLDIVLAYERLWRRKLA